MEEQGGMKNSHLRVDEQQLHNGNTQTTELGSHDDFLEQMLSSLKSPWDVHLHQDVDSSDDHAARPPPGDDHAAVAAAKSFLLHQQLLLSRRSDGLMPTLPLTPHPQGADGSVQPLFNGWTSQQQPFQAERGMGSGSLGGGQGGATVVVKASSGQAPQRQRVRARRGQATDPHSIAERLRRERIAERMKALQELVPNGNKTDKASMLDEIIDYVKFLQLQVKVLSMSRLGGAGAAAPLVADPSSEGRRSGGATSEVTEQQVAKLMEEDMGSAMQYLQGKGLCLMPISLATAISTSTSSTSCQIKPTLTHHHNGDALAKLHDANRPTPN